MKKTIKVGLSENEMPRQWYNIAADLPHPLPPPLGPDGQPITPEMLAPVFPMNLIEQEMSTQRWVDIPEPVLEKLMLWRPSPLQRAYGLEQALQTPARIYYKNEGVSPPGSHKPNTAVAQAFYNREFGILGSSVWSPKPARASGAAPWPWPASCLAWSAVCTWFGSVSTRSRFASSHRQNTCRVRDPGEGSRHAGQPRHRDQRGHRGCRDVEGCAVFAGQRAQPRPVASDNHRARSEKAVRETRALSRRRDRLRGGRVEFCGRRVPLRLR